MALFLFVYKAWIYAYYLGNNICKEYLLNSISVGDCFMIDETNELTDQPHFISDSIVSARQKEACKSPVLLVILDHFH